jgi:hypothetical protein
MEREQPVSSDPQTNTSSGNEEKIDSSVEQPSQADTLYIPKQSHEGSFVFVNPLPSSNSPAGQKIIQRLRETRHGGNDQFPGPNNPSKAK